MTTHNSREWEERFDERFIPNDGGIPTYIENGNDLKEFIHQELQKARHDWLQEEIVKLEGEKQNADFRLERDKQYTTYELSEYIQNCCADTGFNQALQTIMKRYQSELDQPTN